MIAIMYTGMCVNVPFCKYMNIVFRIKTINHSNSPTLDKHLHITKIKMLNNDIALSSKYDIFEPFFYF